jgi:hypothetical protein
MTHPRRLALLVGVAALIATLTVSTATLAEEAQDLAEPQSRIALDLGFDVTSHYTFRGFSQENRGFIGQPWAELGFNLFAGEGAVSSVDLYVGTWNSIHGSKTFASHSPSNWYESDLYFGVALELAMGLSLDAGHTLYMSPSGAFDAIREIGLGVGYALTVGAGIALEVGAAFFLEVDDIEAMGNRVLELNLAPSMDILATGPWLLSLSLPMTLGLDVGEYYGDDVFGFVDVGAALTAPVPFMPAGYGGWEVGAGFHYVRLGSEAAAASAPFVAEGRRDLVYAMLGLSLAR